MILWFQCVMRSDWGRLGTVTRNDGGLCWQGGGMVRELDAEPYTQRGIINEAPPASLSSDFKKGNPSKKKIPTHMRKRDG